MFSTNIKDETVVTRTDRGLPVGFGFGCALHLAPSNVDVLTNIGVSKMQNSRPKSATTFYLDCLVINDKRMEQFLSTPFTQPLYFFRLTAIIFGITFIRYLIVSGVYHYLFFVWLRPTFQKRIITVQTISAKQMRLEVWRSFLTSFIFAFSGTALVIFWQQGWTQIYTDWNAYPIWYHPLSLLLALLVHETYYYWMHRWMHLPKIYKWVHKWHHDSIETSSLTAFSFHPIESILQAVVVPVLILCIPMHLYILFILLLIMTLSGTINHAGVEIFPKGFERHWFGKWLIGASHHDLHHKQFRYNFGLYFTFWDHWMKTESPKYERHFREHTGNEVKS